MDCDFGPNGMRFVMYVSRSVVQLLSATGIPERQRAAAAVAAANTTTNWLTTSYNSSSDGDALNLLSSWMTALESEVE